MIVCFIVGLELIISLHWSVNDTRDVPSSMSEDCAGVLVDDGEIEALDLADTLLEISVKDGRVVIDDCDVLIRLDESLLSVTKDGNSSKSVTVFIGEAGVCIFLRSFINKSPK